MATTDKAADENKTPEDRPGTAANAPGARGEISRERREAREAAALRENLRRRKAAARKDD